MEHPIEELWQKVLTSIETKLSKPSFETWLKSTKAFSLNESNLTIIAPNEFTRDWLENRYSNLIRSTLQNLTGMDLDIKFIIPQQNDQEEELIFKSIPKRNTASSDETLPSMLNAKYTFDTFVIGVGNRFAHAASLAVAEAPAKAYNPLFIYGGVGNVNHYFVRNIQIFCFSLFS